MLGELLYTAETLVATYGLVAIFGIFLLEGGLVGKVIPTRALLFGSVVLVSGTLAGVLSVFAAAVIGATLGQFALFLLIRHRDVDADQFAHQSRFGGRWLDRAEYWFDRWGLSALLISNTLPGVRGYLVIPVALSPASGYRFSAVSFAGTTLYIAALCLIALGVGTTLTV